MSKSLALVPHVAPAIVDVATPVIETVREIMVLREHGLARAAEHRHVERLARELRREVGTSAREYTARLRDVLQAASAIDDPAFRQAAIGLYRELLAQEEAADLRRRGR